MVDIIKELKSRGIPPDTVKLLLLIWPPPIGENFTIHEAAIILGITKTTAYNKLKWLKKSCPLAYRKLKEWKRGHSLLLNNSNLKWKPKDFDTVTHCKSLTEEELQQKDIQFNTLLQEGVFNWIPHLSKEEYVEEYIGDDE